MDIEVLFVELAFAFGLVDFYGRKLPFKHINNNNKTQLKPVLPGKVSKSHNLQIPIANPSSLGTLPNINTHNAKPLLNT